MLKKIIRRFTLGFIYQVFATYVITLLISINAGDGFYHAITAGGLLSICKTELGATCLQFLLSGILGAVIGAATVFWEIDSWSLTKQTVIHCITTTVTMLIIVYLCGWMNHSVKGFLIWLGMFIGVYTVFWLICYISYKKKIEAVNKKLKKR